jgi:hypothetical protein
MEFSLMVHHKRVKSYDLKKHAVGFKTLAEKDNSAFKLIYMKPENAKYLATK